MKPLVRIFDVDADLFETAAEKFVQCASDAVSKRGRFTVALNGGSTPRHLFPLLVDSSRFTIPWKQTFIFWGDERHVPPDDPESNFRMTNEMLLTKAPIPAENVFRVFAEKDAETAAREYDAQLQKTFSPAPGHFPRFDLIMLGMGPDGHTASLFPDSAALQEKQRLVVANWVEKFNSYRITFTYPVLNNAASVMFIVTGAEKAPAVKQVLSDSPNGPPAKFVRPANGELLWLLDRAAAADLPKSF